MDEMVERTMIWKSLYNPFKVHYLERLRWIKLKYSSLVSLIESQNHEISEDVLQSLWDFRKNFIELLQLKRTIVKIDIDSLTWLHNRKRWDQKLNKLIDWFNKTWEKFSMAIIDIDDFRSVNNKYWHWMGNIVLEEFSSLIKGVFWKLFYTYRLWWEEFVVIYKWWTEELEKKLNELRKSFSKINFERRNANRVHSPLTWLNFSAWIWYYSWEWQIKFYKRLDSSLYEAKRSWKWRNKISESLSDEEKKIEGWLSDDVMSPLRYFSVCIEWIIEFSKDLDVWKDKTSVQKAINHINLIVEKLVELWDRFDDMIKDPLTWLKNTAIYNSEIKKKIADYDEKQALFSLWILDLDNFKAINDNYWHEVWDEVLKNFSLELNNFLKTKNLEWVLYRIWWEEFAILSNMWEIELKNLLDEFRWYLKTKKTSSIEWLSVTFSAWVKDYVKNLWIVWIYEEADKLLYRAKKDWKDRTILGNIN